MIVKPIPPSIVGFIAMSVILPIFKLSSLVK
jgi:type II secretory pathway component PulF